MVSSWSLQIPHIIQGLLPNGLRDPLAFSDILLDAAKFLKILSTRFSYLTAKLKIPSFFRLLFSNLRASFR